MLQIQISQGHGKAVKGTKKTSTIQVIEPLEKGYLLRKQFRYIVGDTVSKTKALAKAIKYINEQQTKQ